MLKLSHQSTHATPKEGAIPLQTIPEQIIINDMNLFKNEIEIVLCEEKQKEILTELNTSDQSENSKHDIVKKIENIIIKITNRCKTEGRKTTKTRNTKNDDEKEGLPLTETLLAHYEQLY